MPKNSKHFVTDAETIRMHRTDSRLAIRHRGECSQSGNRTRLLFAQILPVGQGVLYFKCKHSFAQTKKTYVFKIIAEMRCISTSPCTNRCIHTKTMVNNPHGYCSPSSRGHRQNVLSEILREATVLSPLEHRPPMLPKEHHSRPGQ